MLSQTLNFGGESLSLSQPAAGKATRQEEVETCMPATIRMVEEAAAGARSESGHVYIHNQEVGHLLLVGSVEEIVKQGSSMELSMNDSSGRMKVKYYITSELPADLASLEVGHYIKAVGSVRSSPSTHFSAVALKKVASFDEVSYHLIEVAYAAMKLGQLGKANAASTAPIQLKTVRMGDPQTPAPKTLPAVPKTGADFDSPEKVASPVAKAPKMEGCALFGNAEGAPSKDEAMLPVATDAPMEVDAAVKQEQPMEVNLQEAIMKSLSTVSADDGGMAVSLLMKGLPAQFSEAEVKSKLEQLVEDGDIFDTLGDGMMYAIV
mmetsp:Transcript_29861/g.69460  ORF Transcript_29861/g.69460 Transcript_29861/m.69460 type:complete len:321 (+) Transcript_29861:96-1058(+)